jgi:hypothetical protein
VAENLMKLKRRAVKLGMDAAHARKASRSDLEAYVSEHEVGGSTTTVVKKKGRKTAAAAPAPAKKRGRPKGSKNKPAATPTPKAKKKSSAKPKTESNGDAGRLTISRVDYSIESDEWNPRAGSPVERIWKSLKKNRDNVEKVFDDLLPSVKEIVGSKKRNGERRTKAEFEAMLRYRINRTRFEYATRTGQHQRATNRIEYGTGKYATETKKAARNAARNANKPSAPVKKRKTAKR